MEMGGLCLFCVDGAAADALACSPAEGFRACWRLALPRKPPTRSSPSARPPPAPRHCPQVERTQPRKSESEKTRRRRETRMKMRPCSPQLASQPQHLWEMALRFPEPKARQRRLPAHQERAAQPLELLQQVPRWTWVVS